MSTQKRFGGAQENGGRRKKEGQKTTFLLSTRGRLILEAAKAREGKSQLAPALEAVLNDYAIRHELRVDAPDAPGGEARSPPLNPRPRLKARPSSCDRAATK